MTKIFPYLSLRLRTNPQGFASQIEKFPETRELSRAASDLVHRESMSSILPRPRKPGTLEHFGPAPHVHGSVSTYQNFCYGFCQIPTTLAITSVKAEANPFGAGLAVHGKKESFIH